MLSIVFLFHLQVFYCSICRTYTNTQMHRAIATTTMLNIKFKMIKTMEIYKNNVILFRWPNGMFANSVAVNSNWNNIKWSLFYEFFFHLCLVYFHVLVNFAIGNIDKKCMSGESTRKYGRICIHPKTKHAYTTHVYYNNRNMCVENFRFFASLS